MELINIIDETDRYKKNESSSIEQVKKAKKLIKSIQNFIGEE